MSFAVIQTGGKQYKVSAGEILKVEKLEHLLKFHQNTVLWVAGDDRRAGFTALEHSSACIEE